MTAINPEVKEGARAFAQTEICERNRCFAFEVSSSDYNTEIFSAKDLQRAFIAGAMRFGSLWREPSDHHFLDHTRVLAMVENGAGKSLRIVTVHAPTQSFNVERSEKVLGWMQLPTGGL